jgi:TonB-dependent SusC/RagA subfamily outer membrane receptor
MEDYIKYNIAPPKEFEEACRQQGYITKSTRTWRQQLKDRDTYDILNEVATAYNQTLIQWDAYSTPIKLLRQDVDKTTASGKTTQSPVGNQAISGAAAGLRSYDQIEEVVVTGYGVSRQRSLTYSTTTVTPNRIYGNTIEQVLSGKVAGLSVSPNPAFSDPAQILIRGTGSLSNSQPLFILDGFAVDGNINNLVSVNDIENITVFKNASAAALYGSRASNGVIVITTKRYRPSYSTNAYRLKDMPDVDYLEEIKAVPAAEKLAAYDRLRTDYADDPTFYLDMAMHLFESGNTIAAGKIVWNAAEVSGGDAAVLRAIAYCFESWKEFDEATEIYRQLVLMQPNNLDIRRELAWALYQNGNIQESVNCFFTAINLNTESNAYSDAAGKANLLNEMNAIISIHRDSLDLSAIPESLIRPMPADLRIVVSSNMGYLYNMWVREPGGKERSAQRSSGSNGSYLDYSYGYGSSYSKKQASKGKYRISVEFYDYYRNKLPCVVRIICFKNYGRKSQSINIENVFMNNQNGRVEIGQVNW